MVSNINLVSTEGDKKASFSGKAALVISITLLIFVFLVYAGLKILSNRYLNQKEEVETQIQNEKNKISGAEYAELADFQERLVLIGSIIEDHSSYESYLKVFSKYVIPDVHVKTLEWGNEGEEIVLSGTASNFDVLSRQLILFRNSPIIQLVEFKNATEVLDGSSSGVNFELSLKINKENLK